MSERSQMIEWIRGEMVGPSRPLTDPESAMFTNRDFTDLVPLRCGPLAWRPAPDALLQEVLYYDRESPHRKYGMGLLHAPAVPAINPPPNQAAQDALQATDTIGAEPGADEQPDEVIGNQADEADEADDSGTSSSSAPGAADEFEVTAPTSDTLLRLEFHSVFNWTRVVRS